jgi:hypothetical protein
LHLVYLLLQSVLCTSWVGLSPHDDWNVESLYESGGSELIAAGSWSAARDAGKLRLEGKTYIVQDGDVIVFKI